MSIRDRLADADLLWRHGHREGALLNVLLAVQAAARKASPGTSDREAFEALLKSTHSWTWSVEYRGKQVDVDHLFWKWLRCQLVHTGSLPVDVKVDDAFADPAELVIRAGGPPHYTILLTAKWYEFFIRAAEAGMAS